MGKGEALLTLLALGGREKTKAGLGDGEVWEGDLDELNALFPF